MSKNANEM